MTDENGKYPLVDPILAKCQKRFLAVLDRLSQGFEFPEQASSVLAKASSGASKLDERMRQRRYRVGFIGQSQRGKSTAIQNVLEVGRDMSPTTQGATASPATAAPTRVYAISPADKPVCEVIYMTRRQFEERRAALCEFLLIDDSASLKNILRGLAADTPESRNKIADVARLRERRRDDVVRVIDYFRFLLASQERFGDQYLRDDAAVRQQIDYASRSKFTNHPEKLSESPNLLAHEVEIGFPTDVIHSELEMIDLPGVGTINATDDVTTRLYLRDYLFGVVAFTKVGELSDKHMSHLLELCRERFGADLQDRVWLCLTFFEGLSDQQLFGPHGDPQPKTIFDGILGLIDNEHLSLRNLLITSKVCFETRSLGPKHKIVSPSWPGTDQTPLPPPALEKHSDLWKLIEEQVFTDGGVSYLRDQLKVTLAARVRDVERRDVKQELRRLCVSVKNVVANHKLYLDQTTQRDLLTRVRSWSNRVKSVMKSRLLIDEPADRSADRVRQRLQSAFDNGFLEAESSPDDIRQQHSATSRMLLATSLELVNDKDDSDSIPALFDAVTVKLDDIGKEVGTVPLDGQPSPLESWQSSIGSELERRSWNEWLETFKRELFPSSGHHGQFNLTQEQYRNLMHAKIATTVQQAYDVGVDSLVERLADLVGKLDAIGDDKQPRPENVKLIQGRCDEILRELDEIIAQIDSVEA